MPTHSRPTYTGMSSYSLTLPSYHRNGRFCSYILRCSRSEQPAISVILRSAFSKYSPTTQAHYTAHETLNIYVDIERILVHQIVYMILQSAPLCKQHHPTILGLIQSFREVNVAITCSQTGSISVILFKSCSVQHSTYMGISPI